MNATDKIERAKAYLAFHKVFWGMLCLRPKYIEDPNIPTGWTDGRRVGYNPTWIEKIPLKQVITFIAHETGGHIALMHPLRREKRNHKLFNIACDYAINPILTDDGFEPIDGWLHEDRFRSMSAEAIYNILIDELPKDKNGDPTMPDEDEQGASVASSDNGSSDSQGEQEQDTKVCGEVRDMKNEDGSDLNDQEKQEAEIEQKVFVAQAASLARTAGKMPGSLERIVSNIVNPTVDWKKELLHFVKELQRNDYSWQRPNRRFISQGLYLPTLQSEGTMNIAVAIDTSGSVNQEELTQFAAELNGIKHEAAAKITRLCCDTKIHGERVFDVDEDIEIEALGGGGTDFRPPFKWIEENSEDDIAGMIYLTDGWCNSFPSEEPDYPVIWAITEQGDYGRNNFNPPFGTIVNVEINK